MSSSTTHIEGVSGDGRSHGGVPAISLSFPVFIRVFMILCIFFDFPLSLYNITMEFWKMIFRSLFFHMGALTKARSFRENQKERLLIGVICDLSLS